MRAICDIRVWRNEGTYLAQSRGVAVLIEFLERLMINASSPIFLVVDGHATHEAKPVKRFVQEQDGWLNLHGLPAYSPELNPDQFVWNNLKNNAVGRMSPVAAISAYAETLKKFARATEWRVSTRHEIVTTKRVFTSSGLWRVPACKKSDHGFCRCP